MTTTTRPILRSPDQRKPKPKRLYTVKLTAFKKNDHDLQLVIPAYSPEEAWAKAQAKSWGFAYFVEAPEIFPQQKSSPTLGLPQDSNPDNY
jgi:hypothetical protein